MTNEVFGVVNCWPFVFGYMSEQPDAASEPIMKLNAGSEVMVDLDNSTEDYYKVCTAVGVEGYCLKRYIKLNE